MGEKRLRGRVVEVHSAFQQIENEKREWVKHPLTEKQKEVYAYVAGYITDNGYAPTRREITERLGISEQAVTAHLREIKNKGWIRFTDGGWRNIELIPA